MLPGAVVWGQDGAVLLWAGECQDAEGGFVMGETWELVKRGSFEVENKNRKM